MTHTMHDTLLLMRSHEADCSGKPGMCPHLEPGDVHPSTARALLRAGLVERTRCRFDHSVAELRLTDEGRSTP